MKYTDVEIPDKLRKRPMYRGFPITYITLVHPDGVPDFKITDHAKWLEVVSERKCALCGEKLGKKIFIIAGPLSKEHHCFYDPAMHFACAIYALQVCPFLAFKTDYKPLSAFKLPEGVKTVTMFSDEEREIARPKVFYLFKCREYRVIENFGRQLIQAINPKIFEVPLETECIADWSKKVIG